MLRMARSRLVIARVMLCVLLIPSMVIMGMRGGMGMVTSRVST